MAKGQTLRGKAGRWFESNLIHWGKDVTHGGVEMLILSRTTHERILLRLPDGREVWVSVEKVQGDKVRLGVDAPPDVEILREELIP